MLISDFNSFNLNIQTPKIKQIKIENQHAIQRYYPHSIPIKPLPITNIYTQPKTKNIPTTYIRPIQLQINLTVPKTITITKTAIRTRAALLKKNRLRQDKKSWVTTQYNTILKLTHYKINTITEVINFIQTVMQNIQVQIGGKWYKLSSMDPAQRERTTTKIASGEFAHTTDFQGITRNLLINKLINRKIGTIKQLKHQTTLNTGITESLGITST